MFRKEKKKRFSSKSCVLKYFSFEFSAMREREIGGGRGVRRGVCTCVNSLAKGRRSKKGSHPHQSTANSFSLSYLHILAASRSVAPIYELHLYIYIVQETLIFFSRSLPPSSSPAFASKLLGVPPFFFFFSIKFNMYI